jgi:succinate dehydrogenase / fumarate reductase, cytochrome b subunit
MAKERPVNLNLISFKFPLPALVSIGHRITGVLLFFLVPFALYILQALVAYSLGSSQTFYFLSPNFFWKLIIWAMLAVTAYHIIAGVRHLIMDFGVGESFSVAQKTAATVFVLFLAVIIYTGVWLWA